jgi:hypothetical protein
MSGATTYPAFPIDNLLDGIPPAPVLWFTALVDTVCYPLRCTGWRETLGVPPNSWLGTTVPPMMQYLPRLLSYPDFFEQQQEIYGKSGALPYSFQSLYQYAFETESTALGNLGTPEAVLALMVLIFLLRTIKSVLLPFFSSLGRRAGRQTHGPDWEAANEVRIVKFGEYVFRLLYHFSISCYGAYYFFDQEWWAPGGTVSLFAGFPHHSVQPGMTWYYLLQAAYNLDAFWSLLELSMYVKWQWPISTTTTDKGATTDKGKTQWSLPVKLAWRETVRGDFQEMAIHHVVTNSLVLLSSICRLTRIGSMVFMVHDFSDVPVDMSKLANFLKWKRATAVCFFLMVIVWMMTRLYILPVTIYGSTLFESHYVLLTGKIPPVLYGFFRPFFYVGIGLLILLHTAWFAMFVRMGYMLVFKNEVHDLSEHKKGESQHIYGKPGATKKANGSLAATDVTRTVGDEKKED